MQPVGEGRDHPTLRCTTAASPWVLSAFLGVTVHKRHETVQECPKGYKDGEGSRREDVCHVLTEICAIANSQKEDTEPGGSLPDHQTIFLFCMSYTPVLTSLKYFQEALGCTGKAKRSFKDVSQLKAWMAVLLVMLSTVTKQKEPEKILKENPPFV